jgi:CHASE2 domain-containing sensor protein
MSASTPPTVVKPLRIRLIGAAALWLIGILISLTPPAAQLDLVLLDLDFALLRQVAPHPAPDDILLVGIDDATMRSPSDPPAVWQRQLAGLLRGMASGKPRAVILDAGLPERSLGAREDAELGETLAAMQAAAPLIVARHRDASGNPREIHAPLRQLLKPEAVGSAELPIDRDGRSRRLAFFAGEAAMSTETLVARAAQAVSPIIYHAPALIDFALGEKFDYLPMSAALEITNSRNVDAIRRQFAGKIVIVGMILPNVERESGDRPAGSTPGVILRAQALRTLLHGEPVMPLPDWMIWPLYALPACLFLGRRSRSVWLLAPTLLCLVFAGKAAAVHFGNDPPVAGLIIAVFVAIVAWMIYDGRANRSPSRPSQDRPELGPASRPAPVATQRATLAPPTEKPETAPGADSKTARPPG